MVEYKIYTVEPEAQVHIETIELKDGEKDEFHLNEEIAVNIEADGRDVPGQIIISGDLSHVKDFAVCYEDPSTEMLVKMEDLDPSRPQILQHNAVTRLRYDYHGRLEEARFVYSKDSKIAIARNSPTTPRTIKARNLV